MKRGWQIACGVLLVVLAVFVYESLQLSLSDAIGPGPGFFPFWLAVLGSILAVALLVQLHLNQVELGEDTLEFDRDGARTVLQVMVALTVGAALLDPLGFRVSMLLLIAYLLFATGVRNWLAIALCAGVGSFGVYHVFFDLLKVPLPAGIFGI